jgi:hypothetical protein
MVIPTEICQNRWILGPAAVNPGSGGTGAARALEDLAALELGSMSSDG